MKLPSWFSIEMKNLCERQGLTEDQAYERVERLAIEEEPEIKSSGCKSDS